MVFFADGEMATGKNLLLNIFFPSSPNDLKLLQYFLLDIFPKNIKADQFETRA